MDASQPILILHEWPSSRRERAWTFFKMLIKEGVLHGEWQGLRARKKVGGHLSLPLTVLRGLEARKRSCVTNDFDPTRTYEICYVVKDPRCLRWAIAQKRRGKIGKLVAGPLIVNFPSEQDGLILDDAIDSFLLPSSWTREMFLSFEPSLRDRLKIWAAGVDTERWQPRGEPRKNDWLLYVKNPEPELRAHVELELLKRGIEPTVLQAGHFEQSEYARALENARGVIFLSRSETQGLAMIEAWSMDVPTLHWNPAQYEFLGHRFAPSSSCPYLDESCGLEFSSRDEFGPAFDRFQATEFHPRPFASAHFNLEVTTAKLLAILDEAPA